MLKIINDARQEALDFDSYYIQEEYDGNDLLCLTLPLEHPQLRELAEESVLEDSQTNQKYLVKAIDEGANTANIKCALDLDELKAEIYPVYTNHSDTVVGTVQGVLPPGWTAVDHALVTIRRTVELEGATPLDVVTACAAVYSVTFRYDNHARQVHIWDPERLSAAGVYITDELNLKELNYKGKSTGFATRLYAVGKDGLTFEAINDGKSYVDDHTYSDRVICTYWKDERYTVAENLLEDAKKKLALMAVPQRSYECRVVDLARAQELTAGAEKNIYAHLEINMYTVCTLMDRRRGTRIDHRVVRLKRWPAYPEKNEVTLSTVAPSIQSKVQQSYEAISSPNSSFQQRLQAAVNQLVDGISGYNGGNLLITKNADGKPNGIKFMDTEDEATAKKILWINLKGILYSSNGTSGLNDPGATVWSFEKNGFAANWLVTGTLDAALVRVVNLIADNITSGKLQSKDGKSYWDLTNGDIQMNGEFISRWEAAGYEVKLSGGALEFYRDGSKVSDFSSVYNGVYIESGGAQILSGQTLYLGNCQININGRQYSRVDAASSGSGYDILRLWN